MTRAIAVSSIRPLSWSAPGLLSGSERCTGQSIALDLYDWWHFQRLGAHDQALMQRLLRAPELVPVAFDLYGVLYKPQPVWLKERSSLGSAVLHVLESSGKLARIRQHTVLSEWATVMHLNALLEPVEQALQGGREGGQQQGGGARGVAQDAAGLQAACEGVSGVDGWVAARTHGARAIQGSVDRYEQARATLEAFDQKHGLMELPDQRGRKMHPFQMRWEQRTSPPEPPWQRRGVPAELGEQRDALVAAMRAQRERVRALQQAQRAVQARACEEIRAGQGDGLREALLQAQPRVEEALAAIDEVVESLCESDSYGRELGAVRRLPVEQFVRLSKVLRQTPSLRKSARRGVRDRRRVRCHRGHARGPHQDQDTRGSADHRDPGRRRPGIARHRRCELPRGWFGQLVWREPGSRHVARARMPRRTALASLLARAQEPLGYAAWVANVRMMSPVRSG